MHVAHFCGNEVSPFKGIDTQNLDHCLFATNFSGNEVSPFKGIDTDFSITKDFSITVEMM